MRLNPTGRRELDSRGRAVEGREVLQRGLRRIIERNQARIAEIDRAIEQAKRSAEPHWRKCGLTQMQANRLKLALEDPTPSIFRPALRYIQDPRSGCLLS